jgi:hypothetical protein
MRAREYDPATAQFLSVDPLGAVSLEPYTYAEDDPLSRSDVSGLLSFGEALTVAGDVGSLITTAICLATPELLGTCGIAIVANTILQAALIELSSRTANQKIAWVTLDVVVGAGASALFTWTTELLQGAKAPELIQSFFRTLAVLLPNIEGIVEPKAECGG